MTTIRRVVALTLVATALCADRAVASPQIQHLDAEARCTRTFVGRLSVSLRRTVPRIRLVEMRRADRQPLIATIIAASPIIPSRQISAYQFRLPPPQIAI